MKKLKERIDLFLAFSQLKVDGHLPSEKTMFENLLAQVEVADQLGWGVAWVGEAHLSLSHQQTRPNPPMPHFSGEMCINTDILQLAHRIFAETESIEVGSAIRNILCNGGPIAHAEAIRTFLTLHAISDEEKRRIHIGFGTGRFSYANEPYGVKPRNDFERAAWDPLRGLVLREASEIFLRLLRGDAISSLDIASKVLQRSNFRSDEDWQKALDALGEDRDTIEIAPFWEFDELQLIPRDVGLDLLELYIGSQDPLIQDFCNTILPVKTLNLSITPNDIVEATHQRMNGSFHADGGPWQRSHMPRTIMIFLEADPGLSATQQSKRAGDRARDAMAAYWSAMEGSIDEDKVLKGVSNAIVGNPAEVIEQIHERFHPQDRLMAWFDFNDHDSDRVVRSMRDFHEHVVGAIT